MVKLDCSGCIHYIRSTAYYKCNKDGLHIIDNLKICNDFKLNPKIKIITPKESFNKLIKNFKIGVN